MPLLSDNFENPGFSEWNMSESTSIPTFQSSVVYEGNNSLHCTPSTQEVILLNDFGINMGIFGARFAVRRVSAAAETPVFFAMYGAGGAGDQPAVKVQLVGGNLVLRTMPADSTYVDTTRDTYGAMNVNTWYLVDLRVNATANPWTLKWRVNGAEQAGASVALTAGTFNRLRYGVFAYGMTWDAYLDAIQVSNDFQYLNSDYVDSIQPTTVHLGRVRGG